MFNATSINLSQVSLKENAFNMCLNGGTFYPGTGCLCIDNYSGDFCDECLPGWIGEKCDNPENMCETTPDSINCYGKWLFNLTLLDMPIAAKELGSKDCLAVQVANHTEIGFLFHCN